MDRNWIPAILIYLVTVTSVSQSIQTNPKTFPALPQDDIRILGGPPIYEIPSELSEEDSPSVPRSSRALNMKQLEECEELLGDATSAASKYTKAGELYLPKNYNKLEKPKGILFGEVIDISTPVKVHLNIRKISDIDEIDEVITFEMDTIIEWLDAGLLTSAFETSNFGNLIDQKQKVLDPSFLRRIWKPDVFIENLISVTVPDLIGAPARLQFSPSGLVTFTTRVRVKIECDFDFTYYPADTQRCEIVLRSYSHNSSAVELKWRRPAGVYLQNPDDPNFDVAVGRVRRFRFGAQTDQKSAKETFDCLQFTIFIRRRLSYHWSQTYMPSILFLTITWMCFMIPKTHAEVRMGIVMTTLLTLTSMFSTVRETGPVVSYPKAVDYWMSFNIMFVFLILLHFALLYWAESTNILHRQERLHPDDIRNHHDTHTIIHHNHIHTGLEPRVLNYEHPDPPYEGASAPEDEAKKVKQFPSPAVAKKRFKAKFLCMVAKLVFIVETNSLSLSILHLVGFVFVYWTWLLIASDYHRWHVNILHNAVGDDFHDYDDVAELKPF